MTARHVLLANRLQQIHRAVAEVRNAPNVAQYFTVLDTPNCPYVMTWIGPGALYSKGGGWKVEQATARIFGFIEPLGQADIPTRTADGLAALSALTERYVTIGEVQLFTPGQAEAEGYQMTIETGPNGQNVTHGGLRADLQFGGRVFVGFEIQVPVLIQWGAGAAI